MKTSNVRRTLSVALMALALTGLTQVTSAASEFAGETQFAAYARTGQATSAAAVAEPRSTSPLTLYVEDPSGNALQLVHVEGTGWKHGAAKSRDHAGKWLFRKIVFWSTTEAAAAEDAVPSNEALTVLFGRTR